MHDIKLEGPKWMGMDDGILHLIVSYSRSLVNISFNESHVDNVNMVGPI